MNPHDKMIEEMADAIGTAMFKAEGGRTLMPWMASPERERALKYARAGLGVIMKTLGTVTPAMVEAWENAEWLPKGKTHSDFTDEEAARLCCAANLAAILGASPLVNGEPT